MRKSKAVTFSMKVGVGFIAAGLVVGMVLGTFDLWDEHRSAIDWTIGVVTFVTMFILIYREGLAKRRKGDPKN